MKKILSFLPALALLVAMPACQQNEPEEPEDVVTPVDTATVYNPDSTLQTEYTIFLYGNAGGAMDDCIESAWNAIKPVLKDRTVRFVSCYKYGKPGYDFAGKYGQPGMLTLFELTCETDLATEIDDDSQQWPDFDMYDPEWLSLFLNQGKQMFPAKHYAFILYGHGGGFDATSDYEESEAQNGPKKAVIYDEWFAGKGSKRALTNKEFAQGILNSDIKKMDCIFLHNCMMGNLESLTEMVGITDYIVTSAHPLAATQTDNILAFVKAIAHNQKADMATILKRMMQYTDSHWFDAYTDKSMLANGDIEALHLNQIPDMNKNIKRLGERLIALYPTQQAAIDRATDHVYRFMEENHFYDTEDYARLLAQETGDAELKSIYSDIQAGFKKMTISRLEAHGNENAPFDHLSLSIYLMNKEAYNAVQIDPADSLLQTVRRAAYEQSTFHKTTGWGNWLNTNTQAPTNNPTGLTM